MLARIRQTIEQRVRDQVARHARIDPTGDARKVIDIQIAQEHDTLEALANRAEDQEQDTLAAAYRELAGDWLSQLAADLKRRR
jgi:hypothetical protein